MKNEDKSNDMETIFINRELSWLDFDSRVLELSKDRYVPLAEQLKFAAIYASNLDEFFMVRIGSLYDQTLLKEEHVDTKTNLTAQKQLDQIMPKVAELQKKCDKDLGKVFAMLTKQGLEKVDFNTLNETEGAFWENFFVKDILPMLSPQIIGKRHPFPFLRNHDIYVGTMLTVGKNTNKACGIIPISSQFKRLIYYVGKNGQVKFALVEELILNYAHLAFGEATLSSRCLFRVTRNADLDVQEALFEQDLDYREIMSELLKKRRRLAPVRLQVYGTSTTEISNYLLKKLELSRSHRFVQKSPLSLSFLFMLYDKLLQMNKPELFYPPMKPLQAPEGFKLYDVARKQDVLVCYPYQSIRPFVQMLKNAAADPQVLSIKMTLYRVASDSKIIEALIRAAESGKEVVTIVELRARFDEQQNIEWSRRLEQAGCTVIYGFKDYKVHSKLTLITRANGDEVEYITQIGTGNYNEKTTEQYTDLALVSSDTELGEEIASVFNSLAVEQIVPKNYERLMVAPLEFKSTILSEIKREIEYQKSGGEGAICLKCNGVSDKEIIEQLSKASQKGIKVDMIVRGICCLKCGVENKTQNIRVRSIVGRYLEHSRIYAFGKGERERIYIASGDFLTRNTEGRVEVGVKIKDAAILKTLRDLLNMQLNDNVNASEMVSDGSYVKIKKATHEPIRDCQLEMFTYLADAWSKLDYAPKNIQALPQNTANKVAPTKIKLVKQTARPQTVTASKPHIRRRRKPLNKRK